MHTYTPVSVNSDRLVAKLLAEMVYQYKGGIYYSADHLLHVAPSDLLHKAMHFI